MVPVGFDVLSVLDHLDRRIDANKLCAGESSFRRFEQFPGATSDVEDCARPADLLGCQLQDRSLDRLEDDALHPVAVVSACPTVEAIDIVAVHRQHSFPASVISLVRLLKLISRLSMGSRRHSSCSTTSQSVPAVRHASRIRAQSRLPSPTSAITVLPPTTATSFKWTRGTRCLSRSIHSAGFAPPY